MAAQTAYFGKQDAVEEIHDLRVALRKLRSRLSFAAPLYPAEEGQHWKDVLRGWNNHMAGIRELDVLQDEWATAAKHCGVDISNSSLTTLLKAQRDNLAGTLDNILGAGKLTADLLAFWAWSTALETTAKIEAPWPEYAQIRLEQWLKNMRQKAKQVTQTDMKAMHRLRILGKKTRYILEWHAQHHSDKDTIRLASQLQQLQECLGEIHDSDQGLILLHELRQGIKEAELISEIACLVGWQARRSHDALEQFDDLSLECRLAIRQWLKKDHH